MTESMLSNRVSSTFLQIKEAIKQLQEWNKDIHTADDYYKSPEGMKNLAASCMLLEAIGEGINKIDKLTQFQLLTERPEIPWKDVIGIRNHIAHGYFDIDGDIVFDVIKNNLEELLNAVDHFLSEVQTKEEKAKSPAKAKAEAAFERMCDSARKNNVDMSLDEINAEIREVRRLRKERNK